MYAHDNAIQGTANANIVYEIIGWLKSIHHPHTYTDISPMGNNIDVHTTADTAKANDILSSQLCLLPNLSGGNFKSVDKIVLCGSEVLGVYRQWHCYDEYFDRLSAAYRVNSTSQAETILKALQLVVDDFIQKPGFHHVITELVFCQIRAQYDSHSIIPLLLSGKHDVSFGGIVGSTAIRIENPIRDASSEALKLQHLHGGFFKLLRRLLPKDVDKHVDIVERQGYDVCCEYLLQNRTWEDVKSFVHQVRTQIHLAVQRHSTHHIRQIGVISMVC